MWKFQEYSATEILREKHFDHFEAPKTAFFTILAALNFQFLGIFELFNYEIFKK